MSSEPNLVTGRFSPPTTVFQYFFYESLFVLVVFIRKRAKYLCLLWILTTNSNSYEKTSSTFFYEDGGVKLARQVVNLVFPTNESMGLII